MHRRMFFLVAAVAADLALAQVANYPTVRLPAADDSGYLANPSAAAAVLWTRDFQVAYGSFLQLHFADTNLPPGSRLKLYSPGRPTAVQWHDAATLRDYQFFSCQFEGPLLRLELEAAPGSSGNRVLVDEVRAILVGTPPAGDTICGPTDDRALSSDPRACRQDASCTAWLFGPYAVSTAGHCFSSTAGRILHFNVPLSSSSGTPRPSAPNDQYAMEPFRVGISSGIGADFNVAAAVRNSNTGLFPGQAQGSWYHVVAPSTTISGTIRITGYGTGNGTAGSAVGNQAQKTHTGPRASTTRANAVSYATDTTGGNSGSPVIFESTGDVIGVHTHGGCTTSGGANSGTSAARSDYTAARAQALLLHVVGSLDTFGSGCGGSFGMPALGFQGVPELGRTVTARVSGLNPNVNAFGAMLLGFTAPAPVDLGPFGLPGCHLLLQVDTQVPTTSFQGNVSLGLGIPNAPALVSAAVFLQHFAIDATAAGGAVMTNGGEVVIGN